MAGIIPKPIKKTSKLYELAPYFALGLVVAVILAYAALLYFEDKASKTIGSLQEKIAQVGTADEKKIEAQVLLDKQRIDDFSKLFAKHKKNSNFFKFLEENSHPKIWFNKLELDSQDSKAMLVGETSNFETLGQQMALFQKQPFVKSIEISDLGIAKTGQASFIFTLFLDPKIFKNNE